MYGNMNACIFLLNVFLTTLVSLVSFTGSIKWDLPKCWAKNSLMPNTCVLDSIFMLSSDVALPVIKEGYNVDITQLNEEKPVVMVNVITRHAGRTGPNYTYPLDPVKDKHQEIWPEGYHVLTNKGKLEHFELGRYLRQRYDKLLGDRYSSESAFALSTSYDRTIMSAMLLMAGLYPPKGAQIWNPDLLWQPIPVHSYDAKAGNPIHIYFGITAVNCPKYWEVNELMKHSPKYIESSETYKRMKHYILMNTGRNISDVVEMSLMYDYIEHLYKRNITLPEWAQKIFPEPWLSDVCIHYYVAPTMNDQMKRLFVGPLIKEITDQFEAKIAGKSTRKFNLFSGHDDNISNFLNVFRAFNWLIPPFSSAILVELREDKDSNYFVSIFFKNSTEEAFPIEIPGCDSICSLEEFMTFVSPYIPTDWDRECSLQYPSTASRIQGTEVLLLVIILTIHYTFYGKKCINCYELVR